MPNNIKISKIKSIQVGSGIFDFENFQQENYSCSVNIIINNNYDNFLKTFEIKLF